MACIEIFMYIAYLFIRYIKRGSMIAAFTIYVYAAACLNMFNQVSSI